MVYTRATFTSSSDLPKKRNKEILVESISYSTSEKPQADPLTDNVLDINSSFRPDELGIEDSRRRHPSSDPLHNSHPPAEGNN